MIFPQKIVLGSILKSKKTNSKIIKGKNNLFNI
ncbi:MAG: hypothetical protein FD183_1164 [Chitinophagaceae bacterium]|nr:MAG: hypothetical protein FD183_1164 [Chitinophagaceae bacterium]